MEIPEGGESAPTAADTHAGSAADGPSHADDLALVRAVLAGDDDAVDTFAERIRFVPRLLAARNRRRGRPLDDHELADLAQETVATVWPRLTDYRGSAALESWLYPFCVHGLANAARKKIRRARVVMREADRDAEASPPDEGVPFDPGAAEYEHVWAALERVGPPRADVIRLKAFDEFTFHEIAAHLAVPVETAKSWYYRGLRALRDHLAPHLEETSP